MLTNLLATILVSLGVATGNVSSNAYKGGNAFNNAKEITIKDNPTTKQAYIENTFSYTKKGTYTSYQSKYAQTVKSVNSKFYLGNQVSKEADIGTIYNSVYVSNVTNSNTQAAAISESQMVEIYNITPYFTTQNTNFVMTKRYSWQGSNNHSTYMRTYAYTIDNAVKNYIDLTNYYTFDLTDTILNNYGSTSTQVYTDQQTVTVLPNSWSYKTITINFGTISQETTIFIYTYFGAVNPTNSETIESEPNELTINGHQADVNYEVIDLPGLMFNIVTMPFSFISTAFNLTLFPGTPYALNIGNLFLTLIAVFILLWLIKKVFH